MHLTVVAVGVVVVDAAVVAAVVVVVAAVVIESLNLGNSEAAAATTLFIYFLDLSGVESHQELVCFEEIASLRLLHIRT